MRSKIKNQKDKNTHFASYYRWLVANQFFSIANHSTSRLLDIGCDDGFFLSKVQANSKVGVDLKPRISPRNGFSVVRADGCYLPFANTTFDTILAFDIIEHIEDTDFILNSLLRVLADNGKVWISTTCEDFSIFPASFNKRAAKSWGHKRIGYNPTDLVNRFPTEFKTRILLWNEPFFRFAYLGLRLLNNISPALARWLVLICHRIDEYFPNGKSGHIFLEITS